MNSKIVRRKRKTNFVDANYSLQLQKIFANRGIKNSQELDLKIANLLPISSLENTTQAADLIFDTFTANGKIIVLSDYDADGATSCTLLVKFFRKLNAQISYQVPDRIKHGYGMSVGITQKLITQKPDLIITVDNGISSFDGIKLAKEHGIKVLITDHHLPANTLPIADVIVNPNLKNSKFQSKNLCGVGVAFYVACALHNKLTILNWYTQNNITPIKPSDFLDLVALGTVADVVTLDQNNRILIANGLKKIISNKACNGIKALFKVSNRKPKFALASDLGFYIGPRINAAGRMQDMRIGIECLLDDHFDSAILKAKELHEINLIRREVEAEMKQQSQAIINQINEVNLAFGICLYHPSWHEGVVGIVAGRLKEKYSRPVIIFAKSIESIDGEILLKGSARSIAEFNIRDALDNINKRHNLIVKFGGHAMAAGLTIKQSNLEKFKTSFNDEVQNQLRPEQLTNQIQSDGELADFNLETALKLKTIIPWGAGFNEPIFDNKFMIIDYRIVGKNHLKMIVQPQNGDGLEIDGIAFNTVPDILPPKNQLVTFAYKLDINRWQDSESIQLNIVHIES